MTNYSFRKYQPLGLRLWHWLNAAVILGLLATVLLRKTLLSWRTNSVLIQEKLNQVGTIITPDVAKDIAVTIRNPLWDWHVYLGFTLGALFISRIIVAFVIEKKCISKDTFKHIATLKNLPTNNKKQALHYSVVKISYAVFYLATVFMILSGLVLNFKTNLNFSKDLIGLIKDTHEIMMWFFVAFIASHIIGVVIAENRDDHGLVSDMINGGNIKK